ncbi:MAG: hypothetical protein LW721_07645 [Flammeovirgaceae bacterium]|jgi:hypothetical protein|nr:hypothetical protein [Flammeovirgaceae bacterium]
MMRTLVFAVIAILLFSCGSSGGTKVVKPRYHHVWARGNKYRIDIPIGSRHIRMFERKRTKTVRMK